MSQSLEATSGALQLEERNVACEIQQGLRRNSREELLSLLVMHGDDSCTILLQITFDHFKINGIQVLEVMKK